MTSLRSLESPLGSPHVLLTRAASALRLQLNQGRAFPRTSSSLPQAVSRISASRLPSSTTPHPPLARSVATYPVVIPHFEWTLEWALPTPVPQHQFEQSPVAIEVTDRNADPDALVYSVSDWNGDTWRRRGHVA